LGEAVIYASGDQIGTCDVILPPEGQGAMTLSGVMPLGGPTDSFIIVISGLVPGDAALAPHHRVAIHSYSATGPVTPPLLADLIPDARACVPGCQILSGPVSLVIAAEGLTPGDMTLPAPAPAAHRGLALDALAATPPVLPSFLRGTLIETDTGPLPIESLRAGDMVRTVDNGLRPLRAIVQTTVAGHGDMAPIAIAPGALGNYRWLYVSPQHRMLVSDWRAEMWFGEAQVLVAARHLVNGTTIRAMPRARATYMHMIFDRHEIVYAEGIPGESLALGACALAALDGLARADNPPDPSARVILSDWEAPLIAAEPAQPRKTGRFSPAA
jgi:hypothetical protein